MRLFDDLALPWLSAGVDEVGRGPLAGPVVAGAVVLDARRPIPGLKDSKRLNATQRTLLATEIRETALAWALGRADVAEIDHLNILRASHLAMQRAIAALTVQPDLILVDGNLLPAFDRPAIAVIGGDNRVPEISAGAIIAKVDRDLEMIELDSQFPGYGFARHKGYATAEHRKALWRLGPCRLHRSSFAPVRDAMNMNPVGKTLLTVERS
ncbi:MAG: ribonuclease HII [Gammaproteobacteria bacterium]|nr:ribonuclease HII [Gammaproteobacteria bacterium]